MCECRVEVRLATPWAQLGPPVEEHCGIGDNFVDKAANFTWDSKECWQRMDDEIKLRNIY